MPAWKQVHALIFQLSPIFAPRKTNKSVGECSWASPTTSLLFRIMKTNTADMRACYNKIINPYFAGLYNFKFIWFYMFANFNPIFNSYDCPSWTSDKPYVAPIFQPHQQNLKCSNVSTTNTLSHIFYALREVFGGW